MGFLTVSSNQAAIYLLHSHMTLTPSRSIGVPRHHWLIRGPTRAQGYLLIKLGVVGPESSTSSLCWFPAPSRWSVSLTSSLVVTRTLVHLLTFMESSQTQETLSETLLTPALPPVMVQTMLTSWLPRTIEVTYRLIILDLEEPPLIHRLYHRL